MPEYNAQHVYNLVAKVLRENCPTNRSDFGYFQLLVLAFARRFAEDEGFDMVKWVDKCVPYHPTSEEVHGR